MNNYKKYNDVLNFSGNKIREIRESKGLSREDVSNKLMILGLDLIGQAIYDIENNTRAVRDYELYFLSVALECDMIDLMQDLIDTLKKD